MIIHFNTRNDTLIYLGCGWTHSDGIVANISHTIGLFPRPLDFLGRLETTNVIMAHNHPSGVAEPSQADERITRRIKAALELVDIRLLDHLIIGDGTTTSLASRGIL